MRILKKIFMILAVIILLIAAVGLLFFPSHAHVDRSTIVQKQHSIVFNYLQDIQNWNKWSPWYDLDPNAKYTFEGPANGPGATIKWASEKKGVGNGSLTYKEVKPDSVIRIDLNFMENGTAQSSFILSPEGDGTRVTWNFDVDAGFNPLGRIMGSFMDSFLGKDYEKGLSNIKMRVEAIQEPSEIKAQ